MHCLQILANSSKPPRVSPPSRRLHFYGMQSCRRRWSARNALLHCRASTVRAGARRISCGQRHAWRSLLAGQAVVVIKSRLLSGSCRRGAAMVWRTSDHSDIERFVYPTSVHLRNLSQRTVAELYGQQPTFDRAKLSRLSETSRAVACCSQRRKRDERSTDDDSSQSCPCPASSSNCAVHDCKVVNSAPIHG